MTTVALPGGAVRRFSLGPWLFGPSADLLLFGGSAVAALLLVVLGHVTGLSRVGLPEWGWLVCVVAIDVAHVHSTWFRTYLDRAELRRHPLRYALVPVLVYAAGVALYLDGPVTFWRALAYVALFHFIRQQVGWVAVYRARAGQRTVFDRVLDEATVYAATLYPVVDWHARIGQTEFAWFVQGDFVDASAVALQVLPIARALWAVLLIGFALRQAWLMRQKGVLELGKCVVVATTALVWYVGIVATNSDFDFTVTNVIVHGVPYFALLFSYARERRRESGESLGSQIVAGGVGAFLGVLLLLAFIEELAWDRLVWHERGWLFGSSDLELGPLLLALTVPLLALPQAVHYVLDGMLWRRSDTRDRPAQRAALGFEAASIRSG